MLSLGLLWSVTDYLVFGTGQLLVHICELIIVRCVVSTSVLKFIHRWTMLNGQGQGKREEPWEKKGVFALSRQSQVGFCDYVVTRIALCKLTFPSCSAALLPCKGIFRKWVGWGFGTRAHSQRWRWMYNFPCLAISSCVLLYHYVDTLCYTDTTSTTSSASSGPQVWAMQMLEKMDTLDTKLQSYLQASHPPPPTHPTTHVTPLTPLILTQHLYQMILTLVAKLTV